MSDEKIYLKTKGIFSSLHRHDNQKDKYIFYISLINIKQKIKFKLYEF